jgi:GTPase
LDPCAILEAHGIHKHTRRPAKRIRRGQPAVPAGGKPATRKIKKQQNEPNSHFRDNDPKQSWRGPLAGSVVLKADVPFPAGRVRPPNRMDLTPWIEKIRSGDPRALARALSEVEDRGPQAEPLLRELFPHSGNSWRLGITGAPGAGKSTLVNRLAAHLRGEGKSVAILAVDPTSPFTGGSILGDRIRMQAHHGDPGVFIRSMATRGALGGLAPATVDALVVLEASGRDVVLVETVGVGQAEVDVVKLAGIVSVVLTPAMGDDIQALKAGVLEIGDVLLINKADQPGADRVQQQLEAMLATAPAAHPPPIVRTVATEDQGIAEWLAALRSCGHHPAAARAYWRDRLLAMLSRRLLEHVAASVLTEEALAEAAQQVARRERNPYDFVEEIARKAGLQ